VTGCYQPVSLLRIDPLGPHFEVVPAESLMRNSRQR
jgi:hypothetical protein